MSTAKPTLYSDNSIPPWAGPVLSQDNITLDLILLYTMRSEDCHWILLIAIWANHMTISLHFFVWGFASLVTACLCSGFQCRLAKCFWGVSESLFSDCVVSWTGPASSLGSIKTITNVHQYDPYAISDNKSRRRARFLNISDWVRSKPLFAMFDGGIQRFSNIVFTFSSTTMQICS